MTLYVFLMQRPHDKQAWPVVWERRDLAEAEPYRVSEIATVVFSEGTP